MTNDTSRDDHKRQRNLDYPLALNPTALAAALDVLTTGFPAEAAIDLISPVTWGGALVLEARFEDGSRIYIGATVHGNTCEGTDERAIVEQTQALNGDARTTPEEVWNGR